MWPKHWMPGARLFILILKKCVLVTSCLIIIIVLINVLRLLPSIFFEVINCPDGFKGSYCENQCSFPRFGYGCQQVCLCSRKHCHFITGCQFKQIGKFSCGVEFYKTIYDLLLQLFMFIFFCTFLHSSHIYPHISWISIIAYTFHIPHFFISPVRDVKESTCQ